MGRSSGNSAFELAKRPEGGEVRRGGEEEALEGVVVGGCLRDVVVGAASERSEGGRRG